MYGMMFSAKIAIRWMPPPENMLNMPRMPPAWVLEDLFPGGRVDAGQRNVGAEPVDEQRAEREPDALLQFLGLGERAEVEVCRQLFRCRDHGPSLRSSAPPTIWGSGGRFRPALLRRRQDRDRAAGLFDRRDRRFRSAPDRERHLGLQFAHAEQPHAVLGAAQQAGLDQGGGVDGRAGMSSLPASIACCTRSRLTSCSLAGTAC